MEEIMFWKMVIDWWDGNDINEHTHILLQLAAMKEDA